MGDLLQQGSDWLQGRRHAHLTQTVTYRRGAESVDLAATVGQTVFEIADEYGVPERVETRDFLVLVADVVLDGLPVLPERGDRVREIHGDKTWVYEVMAPGTEPCWRYSDPYRKTLRIHTRQVAVEDA